MRAARVVFLALALVGGVRGLLGAEVVSTTTDTSEWVYFGNFNGDPAGAVCMNPQNLPPGTTEQFVQISTNTTKLKIDIIKTYNRLAVGYENLQAHFLALHCDLWESSARLDQMQKTQNPDYFVLVSSGSKWIMTPMWGGR